MVIINYKLLFNMKQATLALLVSSEEAESAKPGVTPPCRTYTEPHLRLPDLIMEEDILSWAPLPVQHIWNNVDGVNYLTEMKNQHIPSYCGSCWAQASTSVVSDRIKIARRAAWPDVNISPQVVISCS